MKKKTRISSRASLTPPLSASHKVRNFIQEEVARYGQDKRWRLPTIRQLAKHLGVSIATVQKVYSSLSDEGFVSSAAKRGSFYHPPTSGRSKGALQIGLAFFWEDDIQHAWESGIYGGLLDASLTCRRRVNFSRFSPTEKGLTKIRNAKASGELDGMIVLPGRMLQPLIELCETLDIPVAFLLPQKLTSVINFVCPDVFDIAARIAKAFITSGRQRLAFVEYVVNDNPAYHTLFRAGFTKTILEHRGSLDSFVHIAWNTTTTQADIEKILRGKDRPDAILCGGDNMALDVIHAATAAGLTIPEQLSVVGGSGVSFHNPRLTAMTRVRQPVKDIGRELFLLVEALAARTDKAQPGHYIPCDMSCGDTTLPAENLLLAPTEETSKEWNNSTINHD